MLVMGRVIGIDPGTAITGFGIIYTEKSVTRHVAAGVIRAKNLARGAARLHSIHQRLLEVIDQYGPAIMSLERSFSAINVQSAFRIGEARAIAMLAAAERGLVLAEYTPNEVKMSVAGYGHAGKAQVKSMVRRTLGLSDSAELADDAADALALALTHVLRARFPTTSGRVPRAEMAGRA